jgi:hypothetical protein
MISSQVIIKIKVELITYRIVSHMIYTDQIIIVKSHRSPINHNFLTMTPILLVLDPTISLRRIDHYYVVCSYVSCDDNFVYTMFVCMATFSSEVTSHLDHPST